LSELTLTVLSLRYSSWSTRAWLALEHAGAEFTTRTAPVRGDARSPDGRPLTATELRKERRATGTTTGMYPVLSVGGTPIHESLAICEWVAERYPAAGLWPEAPLDRAQARAAACEMHAGFAHLREALPCHVFARVPGATLDAAAQADVDRVHELWRECLEWSGGPFLFGRFGIPDAMFFPVLTRFRTYSVALPADLEPYAAALEGLPAVRAWRALARAAPRLGHLDAAVIARGGDPDAALPLADEWSGGGRP